MNKSALRNFAVWARRDLIKRISDRANLLGVYEDKPTKEIQATTEKGFVVNGVTFNYKKDIRDAFVKRVQELGYQDAIEEIAYTWFNRIIALRFMEVNGYLTNGKNGEKIYVIGSTVDGKNEPDALTNADKLSFVDKFTVYDYQDANDNNGLYRYILTKQCNDLNKAMPLMFEEIEDYAELLLPDHLLDKGAIIDHLVNDISAKDFNITIKDDDGENASQVEIVGWLYQFYISEKKDEVFASKDQINKGTLPAVTQLFTPDWVVKYMTDNSLGKMWIDGHKNSKLKQSLKYFVEEAEQSDDVKEKLAEINKQYAEKRVTDITFIDPCCGSGHILVYAFDLFYKMYLESGYLSNEIPSLILKNNLVGIDVDKRAVQLTSFALTMKALSYDKDFLTKQVYPNVIDMKESNSLNQNEVKEFISLSRLSNEDEEVVEEVVEKFRDAELYGSLIKDFRYSPERYDVVLKYIQNNVDPDAIFNLVDRVAIINTKPLICDLLYQAVILSSKYNVVATNPPYMPTTNNEKLGEFAKLYYPDSKTDLFAMFMENNLVMKDGFLAMINMNSWMFLQSYEGLRNKLINKNLVSMLHLGTRAFEEIGGDVVQTTTFVLRDVVGLMDYKGCYVNLTAYKSQQEKEKAFLKRSNENEWFYKKNSFLNHIPGKLFSYWITDNVINAFKENKFILDYAEPKQGIATADNERFLRMWFEVSNLKFYPFNNNAKWFPYNKGGEFRKWYGNRDYVINWENQGRELKNSKKAVLRNQQFYFKPFIGWTKVAGGKTGFRVFDSSFLFDSGGGALFVKDNENYKYLLGFLNSCVTKMFLKIISPTINFGEGHISKIPVLSLNFKKEQVVDLVSKCLDISKKDWDNNEISWDFKKSPLIQDYVSIESCLGNYSYHNDENKKAIKDYELELNKIFMDLYNLSTETYPVVPDNEITLCKNSKKEAIKDLISYIVGCAFGRYSPYMEGLQFAGGIFEWETFYIDILRSTETEIGDVEKVYNLVKPVEDNCITITDNDYGTNKMVDYLVNFVKSIYGKENLDENLRFIANALNEKSTDTPRNVIREYLANDFFKDHCKKYQNRPIYWQFDSGKNGGFRALMYLLRYDENTIPTARLSYLHDIQWKYEQEKDRLEKLIENTSITSEKAKARKELDLIDKQILECKEYDEVLNHAANMRISIDLDDGVKVNYQKFQKLDGDKDKNILSTYLKF